MLGVVAGSTTRNSGRADNLARRLSSLYQDKDAESGVHLHAHQWVSRLPEPSSTPYVRDEVTCFYAHGNRMKDKTTDARPRVCVQTILKKGQTGAFAKRRVVTTARHIFFCQKESDEILDDVLLHDIESVRYGLTHSEAVRCGLRGQRQGARLPLKARNERC